MSGSGKIDSLNEETTDCSSKSVVIPRPLRRIRDFRKSFAQDFRKLGIAENQYSSNAYTFLRVGNSLIRTTPLIKPPTCAQNATPPTPLEELTSEAAPLRNSPRNQYPRTSQAGSQITKSSHQVSTRARG